MKQNLKKGAIFYSAQKINKASLNKVTFFKRENYVCFYWKSIAHTDNFDFSSPNLYLV